MNRGKPVGMSEVEQKLDSIGWDFATPNAQNGLHGIHPYPAKFIPQIPASLIKLFHPRDGSPVLDPFCGSGTTLVEAFEAGLPSIGVDLNPLATLIAKVKTTPVSEAAIRSAARVVLMEARMQFETGQVAVPSIPRVDHWFKPAVQMALAAVVMALNRLQDENVKDALKIALSSIIVRVSNQDSDTRYAAVEKNVNEDSVFHGFQRASASIATAVGSTGQGLFSLQPSVKIITEDLLRVVPEEVGHGIGLVVTSPPYPNAYEYWLYHKYRMYWLGMDPIKVRESEIGARPHYFKKNHQTEADFEHQMRMCFKLLSEVMRPSAYACFVIGRSIIHGREIDNEALLERAATPYGFRKHGSVQRKIALNRKSFNLAHGTINREGIVVFALERE